MRYGASKKIARALLAAILGLTVSAAVAAPPLPVTMLLVGEVRGMLAVSPRPGDRVIAFQSGDGRFLGDGPVTAGGHYQLAIAQSPSYNGATVVLEYQQGRRRFSLRDAEGRPALRAFAGRLFPERFGLDLHLGELTAELSKDESELPQAQRMLRRADLPCDAQSDLNEDGLCDDRDLALARLYGGGISRTVATP